MVILFYLYLHSHLRDSSGPLFGVLIQEQKYVCVCVCVLLCALLYAIGLFICPCAPYSNIFKLFCFLVEQATFCSAIAKLP